MHSEAGGRRKELWGGGERAPVSGAVKLLEALQTVCRPPGAANGPTKLPSPPGLWCLLCAMICLTTPNLPTFKVHLAAVGARCGTRSVQPSKR